MGSRHDPKACRPEIRCTWAPRVRAYGSLQHRRHAWLFGHWVAGQGLGQLGLPDV